MRTGDLIIEIEKVFFNKLEAQTNWGRTQLKFVYLQAQTEVLTKFANRIDQQDHDSRVPIRKEEDIINHNGMNSESIDEVPW